MKQFLPDEITHKIEAICVQGCSHVNQLLEDAKKGNPIEELAEYSQPEVQQIINELKQIMSVYDDRNCTPDD